MSYVERLRVSVPSCGSATAVAIRGTVVALTLSFALTVVAPGARAQSDDANKILKAMSDYVAGQKNISLSYNSDVEVVTPTVQKIQFDSFGTVQMSRPDKIRATRTGGYADVEFDYDGKTATVYGKNANTFAQVNTSGSIDQLIDQLRDKFSLGLPGADLLTSNVYDALTSDVVSGSHIGRGVIDGIECEHLAFRGQDTDWQIWIAIGERPIPVKYVITSKAIAGAPQYTLVIKDWKTDGQSSNFGFAPPADAKKVEIAAMPNIDEVPPPQANGAQK